MAAASLSLSQPGCPYDDRCLRLQPFRRLCRLQARRHDGPDVGHDADVAVRRDDVVPGATQGLPPSLSSMSDMMAPLTSVEELDKRITDLRAVEQWLKLNLGCCSPRSRRSRCSARRSRRCVRSARSRRADVGGRGSGRRGRACGETRVGASNDAPPAPDADASAAASGDAAQQAFDPSGWWSLLQSQFNQLASLAMAQPGMQPAAPGDAQPDAAAAPEPAAKPAPAAAAPRKPAAKRAKSAGAAGSAARARPPHRRPKPVRRSARRDAAQLAGRSCGSRSF